MRAVELALAAVGEEVPEAAVRQGLERVRWPGRFEVLRRRPLIVVDGLHTPLAARRFRETVQALALPRPRVYVVGLLADKDTSAIASALVGEGDEVVLAAPSSPRAAELAQVRQDFLATGALVQQAVSVAEAIEVATQLAGERGAVLVTGSLYTVAEAREHLLGDHRRPGVWATLDSVQVADKGAGMSSSNGRRRVVITGMGALSPLGNSVDEMWRRAVAGESGLARLTLVDPEGYPCQVGGEVRDFDPTEYMDRKDARRMARFSQFAVAASRQALAQSGLDLDTIDRSRVGAVCGNGGGGMPETDQAMRTILGRGGMKVDPLYVAKFLPNMAAGNVTIQLGLFGYTNTVTTACAAATQAIGDATEVIRRGHADVMIAGGAEAGISELGLAAFCSMRALTTSYNDRPEVSSRPFDRDRDGFAPAEGSGMVVLEALDHARARGAEPLAEVIGYGVSADAQFLVAPPDDGGGAARAMRSALGDAGIGDEEIDYISHTRPRPRLATSRRHGRSQRLR